MAFLGMSVPREVGQQFHEIPCEGEKTGAGSHHITMIFFGDHTPIEEVAEILTVVAPIMQDTQPFLLEAKEVDFFEPNPDWKAGKYPTIAPIKSAALMELRARIAVALDEAEIEYSKKFPEFKPHVTLSYDDNEPERRHLETPIQWSCAETVLWAGDDEDDRIVIRFQLPREKRYEGRLGTLAKILTG